MKTDRFISRQYLSTYKQSQDLYCTSISLKIRRATEMFSKLRSKTGKWDPLGLWTKRAEGV